MGPQLKNNTMPTYDKLAFFISNLQQYSIGIISEISHDEFNLT